MKLIADSIEYSSVVGGGISLKDENGRVRFIIAIMGVTGISKEENKILSIQIADAINRDGLELD